MQVVNDDDFNYWCKYYKGLGYNAEKIIPIALNPGYAYAKCSRDIKNGVNNYYLYSDCFSNNSTYTTDDYNDMCNEKYTNSKYTPNTQGSYNCPVGQIRFKCN